MSASPTDAPVPRCSECGTPLASRVFPDGFIVLGDLQVPFRRETDFLVCQGCLSTFRIEDVRDGLPHPV